MKPRLSLSTRPLLLALAAGASLAAVPAGASPATDTTRVIVAYRPGAAAAIRGAVSAARGAVKHEIFGMNAMAVEVPAAAINGLMRNPNVEYVEEDVKRYPYATATASNGSPYTSGQLVPWGVKAVQADQLAGTFGVDRKICIIDSGYDGQHEDLDHSGSVSGEDDTGTGKWNVDENHHGTHVAGTIAALNNDRGVVSVASNSRLKLHIIKVFNASGWAYSSSLVTAANRCKTAGANVISMSLGGSVSSRTEQTAFDNLLKTNVLPIAAAGNGGNSRTSYPAGYASVVSVAAVDENLAKASFSQYNKDVEIAGPGVSVLSTVPMGTGLGATLAVSGSTYFATPLEGSPSPRTVDSTLFDFGLGTVTNNNAGGKVCLIQRGTNSFAEKVLNCQNSGGVAAIIYNNVAGDFSGTLGTTVTAIPSVSVSDAVGTTLKSQPAATTSLAVGPSNYAVFDGTSMATPHVSAVAALVWSFNVSCTATQIRNLLNATARDLGASGRDVNFGYGLVQAVPAATVTKNGRCS